MAKGNAGFGGSGGGFQQNAGNMMGNRPNTGSMGAGMGAGISGMGMGGGSRGNMGGGNYAPQPQMQQNKFDPTYQASQMGRYMPQGHGSPEDAGKNMNRMGEQDYFTQLRNNQQPNLKQTGMENLWLPPSMTGGNTAMSIGDIFGRPMSGGSGGAYGGGNMPNNGGQGMWGLMGGGQQQAQAPGLQPNQGGEMQAQLPAYGGFQQRMGGMFPNARY